MNKKYIKPAVRRSALNKFNILSGSLGFTIPTDGKDDVTLDAKQNSIFEGFSRGYNDDYDE